MENDVNLESNETDFLFFRWITLIENQPWIASKNLRSVD